MAGHWRRTLGTLGIAASTGMALSAPASADLPSPGSDAWEPLRFRSIERATDYTPLPDAAGVRAESRCAASALVLPLGDRDLQLDRTPVLHWRWRVDRPLRIEDERRRGGDDFAARVYVMFRFESERASLLRRARQRLGESLFGTEMPGTALNFVWTSREAPGASWTSPYTDDTRLLALARGASDHWRSEAVDVVEAYRRAFGEAPPRPLGLGLMTDADDSCQHAVARYADFRFGPAEDGTPARGDAAPRPDGAAGIPEGTP